MKRPRKFALLAHNERGEGDVAPPRSVTRRMVARPMEVQPRTATQPRITKRLIRVNFTPGRRMPVDMITDHVTEGSAASVVSWFNNKAAGASAHYQVRKNGDIDQFVEEGDKAWHNGRVHAPRAALVLERASVNPNEYAIGIEHEGKGDEELTPEQRASSLWLHRDIMRRHPRIQANRRHIVGHREVFSRKTCPGEIDVDRIVRELGSAAPVPTQRKPLVVWSNAIGDYLIVVRVVSEMEWYYVRAKAIGAKMDETRASVPLSDMPLQPG